MNKCARLGTRIDVVHGDVRPSMPLDCYSERGADSSLKCGTQGRFFKERMPPSGDSAVTKPKGSPPSRI